MIAAVRWYFVKTYSFAGAKLGESSPSQTQKENGHPIGCPFLFGAADEARTRYLHLGKVALYQMSYSRISLQRGLL